VLLQEGLENEDVGVRPLTYIQRQVQIDRDLEEEMDLQFV
jgi:hypothetical protein